MLYHRQKVNKANGQPEKKRSLRRGAAVTVALCLMALALCGTAGSALAGVWQPGPALSAIFSLVPGRADPASSKAELPAAALSAGETGQTDSALASPTPKPTPEPTPMPANWHEVTPATPGQVTLAFTGDVNFADDWETMQRFVSTGSSDFASAFSPDLLQRMRGADILLCNNEFCLSDRGEPLAGKLYTFRAKPENAALWQVMGADLVGLANNHCGDYGPEAFLDTLDTLSAAGVPYIGAGRNLAEAQQAQYYVANGMTFAFVAATRAEKNIFTPQATETSPGVLYTYDAAQTLDAIRAAKANADFVVVYVHWGTENSTTLEAAQTDLATQYAEAGANLIVGAHPHVLQGAGWRGGTPVFYSLGNFWFNTATVDTALLTVTVRSPEDFTCTMLPCLQKNAVTSLVTDESERQRVLTGLNAVCESGSFSPEGEFLP